MMKTDLDKLIAGEQIYRHEDLKATSDKWEKWTDILQFGSLGGIFGMIIILESMSKAQAKVVVWYLAAFLFLVATVAFFVARKALKHKMKYLNAEGDRVRTLANDAIIKIRKK